MRNRPHEVLCFLLLIISWFILAYWFVDLASPRELRPMPQIYWAALAIYLALVCNQLIFRNYIKAGMILISALVVGAARMYYLVWGANGWDFYFLTALALIIGGYPVWVINSKPTPATSTTHDQPFRQV